MYVDKQDHIIEFWLPWQQDRLVFLPCTGHLTGCGGVESHPTCTYMVKSAYTTP